MRVRGLTFVRFFSGSYVLQTMLSGKGVGVGGMESSDAVPPHYFSKISIDADSRANLVYLPPPKRSWIDPRKCVVMDCDGPKHVLIHDLDGRWSVHTLSGLAIRACRAGVFVLCVCVLAGMATVFIHPRPSTAASSAT